MATMPTGSGSKSNPLQLPAFASGAWAGFSRALRTGAGAVAVKRAGQLYSASDLILAFLDGDATGAAPCLTRAEHATAQGLNPCSSQRRSDLYQPDATALVLNLCSPQRRSDLYQPDATARGLTHLVRSRVPS